jgi:hypothetical protein
MFWAWAAKPPVKSASWATKKIFFMTIAYVMRYKIRNA